MNIKNVVRNLERLISMAKDILSRDDNYNLYQRYITDILRDTSKELTKDGFVYEEDIKEICDEVIETFQSYHAKAKRLKPYAEKILTLIESKTEELKQYIYQNITINDQYYKAKTVFYDEQGDNKTIRYIIATFYSEQEMRAMLSNLQKGYKRNQIGKYYGDVAQSIKNGYRCLYSRTQNENIGDGVHAIIYNEDERVLKVHQGENPVEKVYKFLSTSCKTGLIPEWQEYFYNTLSDKGLLYECKGFDYTGKAPKVLVLSEGITDEFVLNIKQEGLRSGEITLPVANNVEFNQEATFYELVTEYVIPYIQEEEVHYKIGEPINKIISSPIDLGNGKTGKLYPRQQVIAQGMLNGIRSGKKRQILNGDMGIGKTFIGAKLGLATIFDFNKNFNGRMAIYCQQILSKKWQREITQVARPLGIEPNFIEIVNFKDIKDLPLKPNGLEVLLLPKDKVKRSYQQGMATNEKYNRRNLAKINKFIDNIGQGRTIVKEVIIENANSLPLNLMRHTATQIEKNNSKPVILYKEQLDDKGDVKSYKIVTPSKIIKSAFGKSYFAYDFELSKPLWKDFIKEVRSQRERLTKESESKFYGRYNSKHNGLTCPTCGGFIYQKDNYLFDDEKCYDNLQSKPKNKSKIYSKCNHYIKADGTPLMDFEIRGIKRGRIGVAFVDETETVAYVDAEGNPLVENDLIDAKANEYAGSYKINVRKCDAELWSAIDKKGYRVVNSIELMKKYFGKGYIDFCITDESHQMNAQSNQGFTYALLVEISKVMINLTGTLTGGKASDIFYTLFRLYPDKLKSMGYTYNDVNLFIDHYGRRHKVIKEKLDAQYNKSGKGRRSVSSYMEIAGISPLLYTNFLSGIMVSRSIEDMQLPMPELKYYKHEIDMSDELKDAYDDLKKQLVNFMNENKELPLGGSYLHNLLAYPDHPQQPPIFWAKTNLLVANPKHIELQGKLLPKEQRLVDTINKELLEDRKVLVYSIYSGEKGVSDRLMDVLHSQGFKAIELKSKVPVDKREEWIEERHQEGFDVIVTNPSCVQTGLNIIQFPTIYFYECGFDIKILRQSERRAWRVHQSKTCKIFYSYYKESLQEDAMKLIGGKKKASLAIEGVFSEDLLSSMSEVNDNGAKILFDVLKGKIKLKENELDAFGFEDEESFRENNTCEGNVFVGEEDIEFEIEEFKIGEDKQINFFTLTTDNIDNLQNKVAKKRNVAEGQMTLFAM